MISNETLLLYFYDDGLSAEQRDSVRAALQSDSKLAKRYADLQRTLRQMETAPIAAPAASVQRWHQALNAAAQSTNPHTVVRHSWIEHARAWFARPKSLPAWLPTGLATAAILVLGISIGLNLQQPQRPLPQDQLDPLSGSTLKHSLRLYMQSTEQQLASLDIADGQQRQQLLNDIITRNRFYLRAAETGSAPDLARLLRALEPVLLSLADTDTPESEARNARAQLAFELGAMQTKLAATASNAVSNL